MKSYKDLYAELWYAHTKLLFEFDSLKAKYDIAQKIERERCAEIARNWDTSWYDEDLKAAVQVHSISEAILGNFGTPK